MQNSLSEKFISLVQIMDRLRQECPWDREQTSESLRKYILEEAYEVLETIDEKNWEKLSEELGDLLLQILFQSVIASESGYFSLESVIDNISTKLVERHPHVFKDVKVNSTAEVEENWEHIKLTKENRNSLLSGVPQNAPALLRAQRLQEKASRVSFDWSDVSEVILKLEEEINELKQAIATKNEQNKEEEIGDILFSIVNISRFLDISAEDALRQSNEKFIHRFQYIERFFKKDYKKIKNAGIERLDQLWEKAKKGEKKK
jgi:MazG family protein